MERACSHLKLAILDDDDYLFLQEYHEIVSLVAIALKTLEANKYTFGIYLPILVGLRTKLAELSEKKFMFCEPLLHALTVGFEERFGCFMDLFNGEAKHVPLYLAMVTNPRFKLNFLNFRRVPTHTFIKIRNMMLNAAKEVSQTAKSSTDDDTNSNNEIVHNDSTTNDSTGD